MRVSCNGCRVLRKGCNSNCSIRPCLQWIKTPDSQANATLFLAKFYGRAGLLNLLNAAPDRQRPEVFKSLLYEACGRIVNPLYGSTGLLWSGNWELCQNAVDAVLKGAPVMPVAEDSAAAAATAIFPLKACDIGHVKNKEKDCGKRTGDLHRVKNRCRFKKTGGAKVKNSSDRAGSADEDVNSSLCHQSPPPPSPPTVAEAGGERGSGEMLRFNLVEIDQPEAASRRADHVGVDLELTLGLAL